MNKLKIMKPWTFHLYWKLPRGVRLNRLWEDAKPTLVPRGVQVRETCPWRRNYRLPACRVKISEFSQSQIRKTVKTVNKKQPEGYRFWTGNEINALDRASSFTASKCQQRSITPCSIKKGWKCPSIVRESTSILFIESLNSRHKICLTRCFLPKF